MAMQLKRPLPVPDLDTEPFWQAAKEGKLVIQHDPKTGAYQHPPRPYMASGAGFDYEWKEVSGRGKVYSYTIVSPPALPGFEAPYAVVLADLEESPTLRLLANIKDVDMKDLCIGMPVQVKFEQVEDASLPYFVPR